jgi:hypothetical protein
LEDTESTGDVLADALGLRVTPLLGLAEALLLVLPLTLLLLEGLASPLQLPWLDADLETLEEVEGQADGLPEPEMPALLLGLC